MQTDNQMTDNFQTSLSMRTVGHRFVYVLDVLDVLIVTLREPVLATIEQP